MKRKERMEHPQAKLIPEETFINAFGGELSEEQLSWMTMPEESLFKHSDELREAPSSTRARFIICCSCRTPPIKDENLIAIIDNIKINADELFQIILGAEKELFLNMYLDKYSDLIDYRLTHIYGRAASLGYVSVIDRYLALMEHRINDVPHYHAFSSAAREGQFEVMDKLITLRPDLVPGMIRSCSDPVNTNGIYNAKLLDKLAALSPHEIQEMVEKYDFYAFRHAVDKEDTDVINRLLLIPSVFAYVEAHGHEYGKYIQPVIDEKINTLKSRQGAGHVSIVVTQQEAQVCFYILRNLIHVTPTTPAILENIDFLISIPAVRSLLHPPMILARTIDGLSILGGPPNELLRHALRLNNHEVVNRLMDIQAVREQAERDGFYQTERRGQINLFELARNKESSMIALSPEENAMLERVEIKYQQNIDALGEERAFGKVYREIGERYKKNPATLMLTSGKSVTLPLHKSDFDGLVKANAFTTTDKENALKAYYQHPYHTAFRYLSKPNPWMARNSGYVLIDPVTNERWSPFEDYKNLITLLWMAASDDSEPATDGYTIESRVDELIREIALIGRAHNWDKSRIISNREGKRIREEYDDLEGDKPSCFSGTKRRLFQGLKGHPLYMNILAVVSANIHQHVREHMMSQFKHTGTSDLESMLIYYKKLITGDTINAPINVDKRWDVPIETIDQWKAALIKKYGGIFSESVVNDCVDKIFVDFFQQKKSSGSDFMALAHRCQLDVLCQKELLSRSDSLAHHIMTKSPDELIKFLNADNAAQLINAIHIGLLGEIGNRLDAEQFASLMQSNNAPETLQFYTNDTRLNQWLSKLDESDRVALIKKICPETEASEALSDETFQEDSSDNENQFTEASDPSFDALPSDPFGILLEAFDRTGIMNTTTNNGTGDQQFVINQCFKQHIQKHMLNQFQNTTDASFLEFILIYQRNLAQDEQSESHPVIVPEWNIPDTTIQNWKAELVETFSDTFGEDVAIECVEQVSEALFTTSSSADSDFMKFANDYQLDALCKKELLSRTDSLAYLIANQPLDKLYNSLQDIDPLTNNTRLINAIHLGLLGEIGKRFDPKQFAELLQTDEVKEVLKNYLADTRLDSWLSTLSESDKTSLMKAIQPHQEDTATPSVASNMTGSFREQMTKLKDDGDHVDARKRPTSP